MHFDSLHEALQFRIHTSEDKYWYVQFWDVLIKMASSDIDTTIEFINSECTDEELFWFAEVFEEINKRAHSKAFVDALHARYLKIKPFDEYILYDVHNRIDLQVSYREFMKAISDRIEYSKGAMYLDENDRIIPGPDCPFVLDEYGNEVLNKNGSLVVKEGFEVW